MKIPFKVSKLFLEKQKNMHQYIKSHFLITKILPFVLIVTCIFQVLKFNQASTFESNEDTFIAKTLMFANRGVDEDDSELIAFVRSIIRPPSTKGYNLTRPNVTDSDYSQHHQSEYIDGILKYKTDGFFIG